MFIKRIIHRTAVAAAVLGSASDSKRSDGSGQTDPISNADPLSVSHPDARGGTACLTRRNIRPMCAHSRIHSLSWEVIGDAGQVPRSISSGQRLH